MALMHALAQCFPLRSHASTWAMVNIATCASAPTTAISIPAGEMFALGRATVVPVGFLLPITSVDDSMFPTKSDTMEQVYSVAWYIGLIVLALISGVTGAVFIVGFAIAIVLDAVS
ncbi:hypothetical protein [Stenotrophomonas phage StenR_269]|nr:hypothetical protein [Stenotrophomonas phage StenR_269]